MKNRILITGFLALLSLSGCSWFECGYDPAELICGEPMGSVATRPVDDTVSIYDLPRSHLLSVRISGAWEDCNSLDWVLTEKAYDVNLRPNLQAILFTFIEGTHTIKCRRDNLRVMLGQNLPLNLDIDT